MSPEEAAMILNELMTYEADDMSNVLLAILSPYVCCDLSQDAGEDPHCLDGSFTFSQLRAIITWIEQPKAVAAAWAKLPTKEG